MSRILCSIIAVFISQIVMAEPMTDTFKQDLRQAKVSEATITILEINELSELSFLCLATTEELAQIDINIGQAKRIERFCSSKVAPESIELGDLNKVSALDLLHKLSQNPSDDNLLEALRSKSLVQKAEERTQSWAVVEIDDAGGRILDAKETYDYLKHVTLSTKPPLLNKTREGKLIESIDILRKADGEFLLHPLFDGQCITNGYDDTRLDWSKVPQETMKALLWARINRHENFERLNLDANRIYAEVAKESIDNVFINGIIEDYQLALKSKDRRALWIELTPTQDELEICKKKA
jgi:hypothetical protein